MKKIYIAGPDVFESNSIEIGKRYNALCDKYGYIGLYPLDNVVNFEQEKKKIALDIFLANKKLIDECDIVLANLNSFRGKEADSGTVWECGYAYGLGKKVIGYMHSRGDYKDQFDNVKVIDGVSWDEEGRFIEDFSHPINLMIACSSIEIVQGGFEEGLKYLKNTL